MLFDGVCVRALGLASRVSMARLRMCAFWVPGASSVMYIGGKKKDALQEKQRRDLFPRFSPTWPRRANGWPSDPAQVHCITGGLDTDSLLHGHVRPRSLRDGAPRSLAPLLPTGTFCSCVGCNPRGSAPHWFSQLVAGHPSRHPSAPAPTGRPLTAWARGFGAQGFCFLSAPAALRLCLLAPSPLSCGLDLVEGWR